MATTKKLSRQRRALSMLEDTLKSGVKLLKDGSEKLVLTDHDRTRIDTECTILKAKLLKG